MVDSVPQGKKVQLFLDEIGQMDVSTIIATYTFLKRLSMSDGSKVYYTDHTGKRFILTLLEEGSSMTRAVKGLSLDEMGNNLIFTGEGGVQPVQLTNNEPSQD